MKAGQYGRRRDENEKSIVLALRQLGLVVGHLSEAGLGDLLVYDPTRRIYKVLEVKSLTGTFTPDQRTAHQRWPIDVVRTVQEAIALFREVR